MTDPVAQVGRIPVRRVLHGMETEPRAQVVGLGTAQGENRVARPRAHCRQTVGGGAPQQVEENRLRLIVGRVAGGGVGREDPEPGRPRPCLKVGPGTDG